MKKIYLFLLFCLPLSAFAGNPGKGNSSQSESSKISLYIPGFLIKMGSWFVSDKKDPMIKEALCKLRSTSIVVREGCAYKEYQQTKKYDHKIQQLQNQHFEELVSVVDEDEKVNVQLRQNKKGKVRQVIILVDDGKESFVFLRIRCNINMNDLNRWIHNEDDIKTQIDNLVDI